MSESTPGTVAFVLYVLLFGWIGFRRGLFRELSVLIVSIGGFFLLQQNQGLALDVVRQALGVLLGVISVSAKFLASLRAGGAAGGSEPVYTLGPSDWLSDADQPTVLVSGLVGAAAFYLYTDQQGDLRQAELIGYLGGAARHWQRTVLYSYFCAAADRLHSGGRGCVSLISRHGDGGASAQA